MLVLEALAKLSSCPTFAGPLDYRKVRKVKVTDVTTVWWKNIYAFQVRAGVRFQIRLKTQRAIHSSLFELFKACS
jgi:hypothetical protein